MAAKRRCLLAGILIPAMAVVVYVIRSAEGPQMSPAEARVGESPVPIVPIEVTFQSD